MLRLCTTIAAVTLFFVSNTARAEDKTQIQCIADNIYYEARGEPKQGKYAVGHVVMNRVKDKRFPNTPCGVIKQRAKGICQFSWVCRGQGKKNSTQHKEALEIAEEIYYGKAQDNTGGSKFFHARRVKPGWGFSITKIIGNHVFYRGR